MRPNHAATRRNLGLALAELGRGARALPVLYRARDLAPDDAETHLALARCLREIGAKEAAVEAARAARRWIRRPLWPRRRVSFWPRRLVRRYRATRQHPMCVCCSMPMHRRSMHTCLSNWPIARLKPWPRLSAMPACRGMDSADVLDLGCGTGLSGLAIKPFARSIVGIDLSPRMLERAAATGVYGRLLEAELPGCLDCAAGRVFHLALAADVYDHLGDVAPVLAALARVLRKGGLCALSFESLQPGEGAKDMAISERWRFEHDADAVAAVMRAYGFHPVLRRELGLRLDAEGRCQGSSWRRAEHE